MRILLPVSAALSLVTPSLAAQSGAPTPAPQWGAVPAFFPAGALIAPVSGGHLATTNDILAAAALGEDPPAGAGDETGPDSLNTKAEILDYLRGSFAHLRKVIDRIGEPAAAVKTSPISPLQGGTATRLALTVEPLIHAYDHYGQMVEYLRMNGIIPPASRS